MATPTETRALKLMKVLRSEYDRCGVLARSRPIKEVAPWFVVWRHREEVLAFVRAHRLVQRAGHGDGMLMLPSDAGLIWIDAHDKPPTTLERISWIVLIVFTVAAFVWGIYEWLNPAQ